MPDEQERIEPTLGELEHSQPTRRDPLRDGPNNTGGNTLSPAARAYSFLSLLSPPPSSSSTARSIRGREYLAIRAVQAELQKLEEQARQFSAEHQARQAQQRRARAQSTQGGG